MELQILEVSQVNAYIKGLFDRDALLGQVFLTSDMPVRYTEQQRAEYRRLRTLAEQAEQVQVETAENGAFCIRYRMDGKTEQLRFRL